MFGFRWLAIGFLERNLSEGCAIMLVNEVINATPFTKHGRSEFTDPTIQTLKELSLRCCYSQKVSELIASADLFTHLGLGLPIWNLLCCCWRASDSEFPDRSPYAIITTANTDDRPVFSFSVPSGLDSKMDPFNNPPPYTGEDFVSNGLKKLHTSGCFVAYSPKAFSYAF